MGYRYPDTEDLDKNNTLDTRNDYFTIIIYPNLSADDPESMVVTETLDDDRRGCQLDCAEWGPDAR